MAFLQSTLLLGAYSLSTNPRKATRIRARAGSARFQMKRDARRAAALRASLPLTFSFSAPQSPSSPASLRPAELRQPLHPLPAPRAFSPLSPAYLSFSSWASFFILLLFDLLRRFFGLIPEFRVRCALFHRTIQ